MNTTLRLLEDVQKAHPELTSFYKLARFLEITDETVRMYRRGVRQMDDEIAIRACQAAGKSPRETARVLVTLALERARSEPTRKAWKDALRELGGKAAAAVALGVGIGGLVACLVPHSSGVQDALAFMPVGLGRLYIMLNGTPLISPVFLGLTALALYVMFRTDATRDR